MRGFRIRKLCSQIGSFEGPDKEELHRSHALFDGVGCQLPVTQQVKLKLPDLFRSELIGRQVEILGEIP
jgi:hypothetical protein